MYFMGFKKFFRSCKIIVKFMVLKFVFWLLNWYFFVCGDLILRIIEMFFKVLSNFV